MTENEIAVKAILQYFMKIAENEPFLEAQNEMLKALPYVKAQPDSTIRQDVNLERYGIRIHVKIRIKDEDEDDALNELIRFPR
jgi:hypothetical protein